jgi:hypothetical protein
MMYLYSIILKILYYKITGRNYKTKQVIVFNEYLSYFHLLNILNNRYNVFKDLSHLIFRFDFSYSLIIANIQRLI